MIDETLPSDFAADRRSEQFPFLALEASKPYLLDGREISRACVDRNARQQLLGPEAVQVCGQFHNVLAREVIPALFQHLDKRLRNIVASDYEAVGSVAFWEILGEEFVKCLHA